MHQITKIFRITLIPIAILTFQMANAKTYTGRVVGVTDGDTITVLDKSNVQHKVRLSGIDAPEKAQAYGQRSKQSLSAAVFSKQVSVESSKRDRRGREIGKITVDGQDANLSQIRQGMAWHYKAYEKEQSPADRSAYAQAETEARIHRSGLWIDTNPIAPWDFRHGTGNASVEHRLNAGEPCPCGSEATCTGSKGGIYCTTASGGKKYQ